ncbi:hypothetical protein Tco_1309642 [Tanacetum coccineum]
METLKDVYSKHRIIVVTSLKIMEFFGYKHLEEITVRRQDDKLYKFREGYFKRLRRKDIEDMLLLLVQGKLTNLNVDEWFALNVALRMYTRRIVIQECVEDLQLALESYQKKINLTKLDTCRSDIRDTIGGEARDVGEEMTEIHPSFHFLSLSSFPFHIKDYLYSSLATLDGLDVSLLGDVIGEDDCDDDG